MFELTTRLTGVPLLVAALSIACDATPDGGMAAPTVALPPAACDRDCLLERLDRYFAALAANDPRLAPFAADARFTENAQSLELGDGLWSTATQGPEGYRLTVADAETGQVGFFVLMRESEHPIWLAGRLRVVNREIAELETLVIRAGSELVDFELDAPDEVWAEELAASQRRPRDELVDIADRYLESLDENLADYVAFDKDCERIENGVRTTNNPALDADRNGPNVAAMSCRDSVNSMIWHYISDIGPRRFLAVDEERGIVFGVFMFHHDGTRARTEIPGFGVYTYGAEQRRPYTAVTAQMFKIVDGRIRQLEVATTALPYGSRSGWDP